MDDNESIRIDNSKRFSPIWIVPIIALVVGAWLGLNAISEQGPIIQISFDNASGIAVEKTEIRYKDVKVGKVTGLRLSADLKTVYVTAEMSRDIKPHLSENTRFWVVRPQISFSRISGLSTLLSGVYIEMDPGESGKYTKSFSGLEQPPPIDSDTPGKMYILRSQTLGSVQQGSPVYFREIKVGEVTNFYIDENDGWIEINVFITAPYDRWVNERSRFWNISGIKVSIGAEGINAETGPLSSLILGGIAFDEGPLQNSPAKEESYFYLYPNYTAVLDGDYTLKYPYVLHFKESVRGLKLGSTVEYKGIKVGKVTQIELYDIEDKSEYGVNVFIEIEPQRFDPLRMFNREEMDKQINDRIKQGLRAQLKISSLLTGALFIDLVKDAKSEGMMIDNMSIPAIPTITGQHKALTDQITHITQKLDQFPVSEIGKDIQASLSSIQRILTVVEENKTADHFVDIMQEFKVASKKLTKTLDEADKLIQSTNTIVNPDSEFQYELLRMIEEVRKAARSIDTLSTTLHEKPEAVIFGKGEEK